MRVVVLAVLGRTLNSTDFGIVAAAISVNVILYGIRDIGIGMAIVQRKTLEPSHITTAFALSMYLGLAMSALLWVTAPLIGDLYQIPASIDVLRVLGLLFALRGVSTVSRMMAQREMNFRVIAIIDAVAFVIGSVVSMVLAGAGAGPWALVVGYLVEEVLSTTLYLYTTPVPFSLRLEGARLRELLAFGTKQTFGQVIGTLANNADNFVIGNALGATALGFYTRAYDLVKFPSTVFTSVVGSVLFPAFARFQDDRERLAANFRRVLFVNALVLLPASAALAILAPEVIEILMGRGWSDAVVPFQVLAITMLLRTSQRLGAIVGIATGAVGAVALAYTAYLVFVLGGAIITIRWGIIGVAASTALALLVCNLGCSWIGMRVSGLRLSTFAFAHVPGLVLAVVATAVAWPLASVLRGVLPTPIVFGIVALASVLASLVVVAMWVKLGRGDFAWLGDELKRVRRRSAQRDASKRS